MQTAQVYGKMGGDTMVNKPEGYHQSSSDRLMYILTYILLSLLLIVIAYPLIVVISSSFSSPEAVSTGKVFFLPVEPSIEGYKAIFSYKYILIGYKNTIIYTLIGTLISVSVTMVAAYVMSRNDLPFRGILMGFFVFTMFFSGGLIPSYILITKLKMVNTMWALVIPGAVSVYNMILARTYIMSNISVELLEAVQVDGCSDFKYFLSIVLPLSKPVIAVITLYCVVGHWNSYFGALIYLNDRDKFPLQLVLRDILVMNQITPQDFANKELLVKRQGLSNLLKHSTIVVSSLPIIIFYPFIQKYFVKGVMIGSIKG